MHKMGLSGKRPKEKYHSYKGEVGKIADNLLQRDFTASKKALEELRKRDNMLMTSVEKLSFFFSAIFYNQVKFIF